MQEERKKFILFVENVTADDLRQSNRFPVFIKEPYTDRQDKLSKWGW
jgi:hypothetical protein